MFRPMSIAPGGRWHGWLLCLVLCAAAWWRLNTVHFGLPGLNDPDELIFELGALRMLRSGTGDPGWFGHPATTTMYVLAVIDATAYGVALLTGRIATARDFGTMVYADPTWVILPGRIAMVAFGVGTAWLTWRLAARLFGWRTATVAALLVAVDPVHIHWSQVIRSDGMACFFMLLCLNACLSIMRGGRWRDYGHAALWLALAIATKWPFALTSVAITAASVVAVRNGVLTATDGARRLIAAAVGAVVVLIVVSPYLVIDHATVLENLHGEHQIHHLGANGGGPLFDLRWYLGGPLLDGFGVAGLLLIAVGMARVARHREASALIGPVALAFAVLLCTQPLVWERWALPLIPLGAITAAAGLLLIVDVAQAWHRARGWLPAALLAATLIPLGVRARDDAVARMHDTRQLASAWARSHVRRGSTLLIEHQASDLVGAPWTIVAPLGNVGCVDVAALVHGRTSYAPVEHARVGRSNLDYGTVAPEQRAGCRADFAILTQYDRYRQERGTFPQEYDAYVQLVATGTVVATFAPQPGKFAGPVVTIVDFRYGQTNQPLGKLP